jgi:hypothetical protein
MDLRVAGDAWFHDMPHIVAIVLMSKLSSEFGALGPRPDKTHLPAQYIPKLRQFVQAEAAEVTSQPCAARISGNGPDGAEIALGFFVHASKFDYRETAAVESDSDLSIEDGASVGEANSKGDDGEQGREKNETSRG